MAMKAPKGTRDMLPQDAYRWQYIEEEWAKICSEYGFREIRTPVFESTDLFNRERYPDGVCKSDSAPASCKTLRGYLRKRTGDALHA